MRLLLDTHVLLWWLSDDSRLGRSPRAVIADGANEVVVSAATVWEIGIKQALGKLDAPDDLAEQIDHAGFTRWLVTFEDARAAALLPRHHDDPFDRMLIAQARLRSMTVVSADSRFVDYDVELMPT